MRCGDSGTVAGKECGDREPRRSISHRIVIGAQADIEQAIDRLSIPIVGWHQLGR